MLTGSPDGLSASSKMIFQVFISLAVVFVSIEARAFPGAGGKSLEQLVNEFKTLEKGRHEALIKVQEKPEFRDDVHGKKYLELIGELDKILVETRKALKDFPFDIEEQEDISKSRDAFAKMRRLREETVKLSVELDAEVESIPASLNEDVDNQVLLVHINAAGKKLLEIGLRMLMEALASVD